MVRDSDSKLSVPQSFPPPFALSQEPQGPSALLTKWVVMEPASLPCTLTCGQGIVPGAPPASQRLLHVRHGLCPRSGPQMGFFTPFQTGTLGCGHRANETQGLEPKLNGSKGDCLSLSSLALRLPGARSVGPRRRQ